MIASSPSAADQSLPQVRAYYPTVLVVDDEPEFRDELRSLLEPEGYQMLEASNGDDALSLIFQWPIAVMVTDLAMPGLNGFELLRMLHRRSQASFWKIAVTEKYAMDASLKDLLLSLGAHYTMTKSDIGALLKTIRGVSGQ